MSRILVVEDEAGINTFLKRGLAYKGFEVKVAECGEQALESAREYPPDLVVLDVMLPDISGFEVCRRLRAGGDIALPILMLTAKDGLIDKVAGLESGADDYITKPFAFEELLARVRAGLRRVSQNERPQQKLIIGDLTLNFAAHQVWRGDTMLELTNREYNLLELLGQHAGQVLTKEIILERIWGYDNEVGLEVIKVYINYLRAKLNITGKKDLIHTIRGVGYMLKA